MDTLLAFMVIALINVSRSRRALKRALEMKKPRAWRRGFGKKRSYPTAVSSNHSQAPIHSGLTELF
jgi:hypothetical protein